MWRTTKILSVSVCLFGISGCMIDGQNSNFDYQSHDYERPSLYPDSYENTNNYEVLSAAQQTVVVPESYHVVANQTPTPVKNIDKSWVSSQDPQHFTIDIANGDKASYVANILQTVPKNAHTAEVKYQQAGSTSYKGFYGSYSNQEDAAQALSTLPENIKLHAKVITWGSAQQGASE